MNPPIKTLWWQDNALLILDQSVLPVREKVLKLKTSRDVRQAIRELKIRGAPAIGVAAAYGVALAALNSRTKSPGAFRSRLRKDIEYLKEARPTAYNLFASLDRMGKIVRSDKYNQVAEVKKRLLKEANAIYREDLQHSSRIGERGSQLIRNGMRILTHCNAGGLATAGLGTALAVLYAARNKGKKFHVFVDETRPVLQGSRLTAYELEKTRIPYTLICDNMAGYLMAQGKIDLVLVGADRITANGDTANKIGTYSLAVLAHYHGVKFFVAAPSSTFHLDMRSGREIPIEERPADEIRKIKGVAIAPEKAPVYNPAFDVTPGKLISGFITEKGVIRPPFQKNIRKTLQVS